ncbi:MAG: hypothetical protein ABL984_03300 [Pyrinomonadaceae bacterium]
MNAKHSAILLSGLLLMMIGIAWAQSSDTAPPTCPALSDEFLQGILQPTAWARADWNAKTSRWEIDCTQMDSIANMPASYPANAYNALSNAPRMSNALPSRGNRRPSGNGNYVNTNPYKAPPDTNIYTGPNANTANVTRANAVKPAKPVKREPNTRRPGN